MSLTLITGYVMTLSTPDCYVDAEWYRATIKLNEDISEALPYINAEIEDADYDHAAKVLLWKKNGKKYALRPTEISIAPVDDREEAAPLADEIIRTVNDIWDRRDKIEPDFEPKPPPPKVLDIYRILPKTNCRECGLPSCMAFAAALRKDPATVSLCPYFTRKRYEALIS